MIGMWIGRQRAPRAYSIRVVMASAPVEASLGVCVYGYNIGELLGFAKYTPACEMRDVHECEYVRVFVLWSIQTNLTASEGDYRLGVLEVVCRMGARRNR